MAFHTDGESRMPTSYGELQGVQVKISEKYKFNSAAFVQEVELSCMTLRDLNELDKYEYDFTTEEHVMQNFGPARLNGQHNA